MTESYEIVKTTVYNPKREKDGHYRRTPIQKIVMLIAAMCAIVLSTIIICPRVAWCEATDAKHLPEPVMVPTQQQAPTPQQPEQVCKEPEPECRYVLYDVPLSEELQHYTQDLCEEYGVSYPLVIAIMKKESEFLPDVVSTTSDYGIMQINQGNHDWLEVKLGITDWFDPEQNILAGVYMLSQFNEYEDVHQILMSYNCGPSGAKKLWAEGVYSTSYSRAVVEILNELEVISSTESP